MAAFDVFLAYLCDKKAMKKMMMIMMLLVLTIGAWGQDDGLDELMAAMIAAKIHQDSIDTSSLVAVYDYECKTQDADGKAVTDRMKLCLQVGQHSMRSYPYRKFLEDTSDYEYMTGENYLIWKAESYCFMPEVWTNYPDGKMTVRDMILPNHYETCEPRKPIEWTLREDTAMVSCYLCHTATCELHGRKWTVRYTDDIPSSAGPWKLGGLPGLILDAVSDDGIHHFALNGLQRMASPIYYEHNAITKKVSEQQLIKNRKKIFGNKQYPKHPMYYIPDRGSLSADLTFGEFGGEFYTIMNGVLEPKDAHVFQALELK